jgi:hypothetical protein
MSMNNAIFYSNVWRAKVVTLNSGSYSYITVYVLTETTFTCDLYRSGGSSIHLDTGASGT